MPTAMRHGLFTYCNTDYPMNKPELDIIEKEVRRIADELLAGAKENADGLYWETLHRQPYGHLYLQVNEEIYNGVSGITVFFIALYHHTRDQRYLDAASKSAQWLLHYVTSNPIQYFTFYTGLTGVVYVYLKLFEATGHQNYLSTAADLLEPHEEALIDQVKLDDLLSGHAGNLVVLTNLYLHTHSSKDLQRIKKIVHQITAHARLSRTGIKWGYKNHALDSFTGMSHGAAGIGYALLEVGTWLQEDALIWMAEKAFAFEDEYYSTALNTWIDLRIMPAHEAANSTKDLTIADYFSGRPDINTWAHGVAGMGLSRLRAFQLTGKIIYKKQAQSVINRMLLEIPQSALGTNYTLSTGYGAWIIFLQQASVVLEQPALRETALQLGLAAIQQYQHTGFYSSAWYMNEPDPALMVGTAGVGYALLMLLQDASSNTILTPTLPAPSVSLKQHSPQFFQHCKKEMLEHHFKQTLQLLPHLSDEKKLYQLLHTKQEWKHFRTAVLEVVKKMPDEKGKLIFEIFKQEWSRFTLSANPALALYRERYATLFRQWAEQPAHWIAQENVRFVLSQHVVLLANRFTRSAILRAEAYSVHELYPTTFCFIVLKALKKPRTIEELSLYIARHYRIKEVASLREKVCIQLHYCLQQWLVQVME